MSDHKLMTQLNESSSTHEEIRDLFYDLQYIFDNPFDAEIAIAVDRGCVYVEHQNPLMN